MNDVEKMNFMLRIAEQFFNTEHDEEQIPINPDSLKKLLSLGHKGLLFNEQAGKPIGWIVTVPTINSLKDRFLNGEATERELFEKSEFQEKPEAVYICSAFVLPGYRKQGIAENLLLEAMAYYKLLNPEVKFFAWGYSSEGTNLINKLKQKFDIEVKA